MRKRLAGYILVIVIICSMLSPVTAATTTPIPQLTITYLDVGQGDCEIVQSPDGKTMLIDAGNNGDADTIINALKSLNIKRIDVMCISHPHEDHEGSADDVINNFSIGTLYMNTKCLNNKGKDITPQTKTHRDVMDAIKNKKLKPVTPKPGTVFKLGKTSCTVLGPVGSRYNDLNDFSIVIKLTYNKVSWLFEGDAEALPEKEMLAKQYPVKADVLKVAHHGSDSGTSDNFIDTVQPRYAVVSVGTGNRYKHPYKSTMEKLQNRHIPVYRTDEEGTITCTSNGTEISFDVSPGDYTPGGDR